MDKVFAVFLFVQERSLPLPTINKTAIFVHGETRGQNRPLKLCHASRETVPCHIPEHGEDSPHV